MRVHVTLMDAPTALRTQDEHRQRALVVPDKAERLKNFHAGTLQALAEIMGAVGVTCIPDDLSHTTSFVVALMDEFTYFKALLFFKKSVA